MEWTLKDVLDYRRITTGQFARLMGVNKKTVEGWLKPEGLKGMRAQRLQTICKMLDCGVLITPGQRAQEKRHTAQHRKERAE